jgi:hypothetical protein
VADAPARALVDEPWRQRLLPLVLLGSETELNTRLRAKLLADDALMVSVVTDAFRERRTPWADYQEPTVMPHLDWQGLVKLLGDEDTLRTRLLELPQPRENSGEHQHKALRHARAIAAQERPPDPPVKDAALPVINVDEGP